MGLNPSPHDPGLLSGVLTNHSYPEFTSDLQSQIHVGLYVKNLVFYSSYPAQEAQFKTLPQDHIQVDFMRNVEYFLGTAFTWTKHADRDISVHLCQSAFTEFTAHRLSVHTANKVPSMTPYRSGSPIESIPPVYPLDPDIPHWKKIYQSIVGWIKWLATYTHPEIYPVLTFPSSYSNAPHPKHYNAAVHDIKYLTNINEYGIYFHSKNSSTIHAFNHFPHNHDKEAYTEAMAPTPS